LASALARRMPAAGGRRWFSPDPHRGCRPGRDQIGGDAVISFGARRRRISRSYPVGYRRSVVCRLPHRRA